MVPSLRDWSEDFKFENGNYKNQCMYCKNSFMGHKRRIVCKVCTNDMANDVRPSSYIQTLEERINKLEIRLEKLENEKDLGHFPVFGE